MYSSIILSKLFTQSLEQQILPKDWKVGRVIPLHKGGDKHNPLNFRPISLTSIPCKILEHVIYSNLINFLDSNSFFHPAQHGFRKFYSCETQLLTFTHDLHVVLDRGSRTDCIFLDFSKAFDKVPHALLLHKLRNLNIDNNILNWIESFLTNRFQFVCANGTNSSLSSVNSGVPQGSVLGPLLFLIYINDLPMHVSSSISLYADDCVIYKEIINDSDISVLQTDINNVTQWCSEWHMELNTSKCRSMRVSRHNNTCPSYNIINSPLLSVTSYKYLGVHLTNDLSWNLHVEYVTNSANRLLGYLKRNLSLTPVSLKLLIYKTLVRTKLEYAASIWDPGITLSSAVESIQNRSARFILSNYHRTSSVTSMKASLSLPNLSLRRKISRLCLFQKIFHSNPTLRQTLFLEPSYISLRTNHHLKVGVPQCNTSSFNASFLPQTSIDWNRLPAPIVSITDATDFKIAITKFFDVQ